MSWQIDYAHSHIYFTVRHMMISKVRGRFEKWEGSVVFDENNPEDTAVNVTVDVASVNTREQQRDDHLRSADFFNVAEFPQMTFKSTRVERTGDDTAKLYGDLTIRGVTNEIVLDVEYAGQAKSPWGTFSAGFSASGTLTRKDWDLTWNQALETGGMLVGDQINIEVELELVKQPESTPA
ncbi:MAG: polyisoprenoid-binding protein [Ardenticatenaceae bacterium]|nr:polyisoprenoid-binding protein [Ardenticatenaceae bacterium]MCB8986141.1 polyisoprenoid-binding protein [Ardenticatenaceae bacterium]